MRPSTKKLTQLNPMLPISLTTFVVITAGVTTGIALWLVRAAWRQRPAVGAESLSWLTLTVAVWSSGKMLMVLMSDLGWCILAAKYMLVGLLSAPVLLLIFVLIFTGFDRRIGWGGRGKWYYWLLLWIIPCITLLIAWGYPWLRLHWAEYQALRQGGCVVATYGPWFFFVHTVYTTALVIVAVLILSWYAFSVRGVYRQTALIVAAALFVPLPISLSFLVFRFPAAMPVDWSYMGLLVSCSTILIAVKRRNFLDMRPIAVDQLLEQMTDAILVIDRHLRIVDCNRAALGDLGVTQAPLGLLLPDVLERFLGPDSSVGNVDRWSTDQLLEVLRRGGSRDGDLVVTQPMLRHYNWRLSQLKHQDSEVEAGWILVWRDVTQDRLKLAALYEQERVLTRLSARQHQEAELVGELRTMLEQVSRLGHGALAALEQGSTAVSATAIVQLLAMIEQPNEAVVSRASADPIDEVTFLDAMATFLQGYGRAAKITITFTCTHPEAPSMLSPWMLVQLVRILQEILDSVRQCISPQALDVSLSVESSWIILAIRTEGSPHPDDDPTLVDKLRVWIEQSSVPQRLAAIAGQFELLPGSMMAVSIRFPRAVLQRIEQLRDQRVLIGCTPAMRLSAFTDMLRARGMDVVGSVSTVEELAAQVQSLKPQLLLIDVNLLEASPSLVLHHLRQRSAEACTIVLLASTAAQVEPGSAIRNGADGYLITPLPDEQFVTALANLLAGDPPLAADVAGELLIAPLPIPEREFVTKSLHIGLTDRQREILTLVVRGFTYREIAMQIYVSERTIRHDVLEIRRRMGVTRRSEMVEYAIQHDLVQANRSGMPNTG